MGVADTATATSGAALPGRLQALNDLLNYVLRLLRVLSGDELGQEHHFVLDRQPNDDDGTSPLSFRRTAEPSVVPEPIRKERIRVSNSGVSALDDGRKSSRNSGRK